MSSRHTINRDEAPADQDNALLDSAIDENVQITYENKLFEINSQHKVIVTSVDTPEAFSVRLVEDNQKFQDMMFEINKRQYKNLTKPPIIGQPCLSRVTDTPNGKICRASILELSASKCKLYFVDFGITRDVSYCDIFQIPDEYVTPKGFIHKFSLSGVKKLEKGPYLTMVFKDLVFDNCLTMKVVAPDGPPLMQYCELFSDNKNILHSLLIKILQFKTLDMLPVGTTRSIRVSHVVSCIHFYVQLSINTAVFEDFENEIRVHCENSSPPGKLPVDTACCAIFADDGKWYRAIITEVNRDYVIVKYIDIGCMAEVHVRDLRIITPALTRLPGQAVRCALKGYENQPLNENMANIFELITSKSTFMANIVGMLSRYTKLVTLVNYDVSPPIDVATEVIKLSQPGVPLKNSALAMHALGGSAHRRSDQQICQDNNNDDKTANGVNRDQHDRKGRPKNVGSQNRRRPRRPDQQLYDARLVHTQRSKLHLKNPDPVPVEKCDDTVPLGEILQLEATIGQQILCRVTNVISLDQFYIQLLDEKFKLNSEVTKAMDLPEELRDYSCQTLCCSLNNHTADSTVLMSLDELKNKLTGNKFIIHINGLDGFTLKSTLYELVTGRKVVIFTPDYGTPDTIFPICARAVYNFNFGLSNITHLDSLDNVYLQKANDRETIASLLNDLNNFYKQETLEPLTEFEETKLCAARSGDGNWYRVTITSVKNQLVKVHLIDYGNSELIPKGRFRKLDSKFYEQCALALSVNLGLVALQDNTLKKLSQWTTGKELYVTLNSVHGRWLADLVLCDVDIATKLIDDKLAAPKYFRHERKIKDNSSINNGTAQVGKKRKYQIYKVKSPKILPSIPELPEEVDNDAVNNEDRIVTDTFLGLLEDKPLTEPSPTI